MNARSTHMWRAHTHTHTHTHTRTHTQTHTHVANTLSGVTSKHWHPEAYYLMVSVEPATELSVMSAPRMLSMAVVSDHAAWTALYELYAPCLHRVQRQEKR